MAAFTKKAISVTMRDRAKQSKIWDHKGYKGILTNIFKNSNLKKKCKMAPTWTKVLTTETVWDHENGRKIWDHKGYNMCKSTIHWKFYNFSKIGVQS